MAVDKKAAEVIRTPETKVEAVKEIAEEKKETGAAAVKEVAKEITEETKAVAEKVKETAKATAKRAAKAAPKKALREDVKPKLVLEYMGDNGDVNQVVDRVKEAFVKEGHRVSSIKALEVYMKPEDRAAYYVINGGKFTGRVDLF